MDRVLDFAETQVKPRKIVMGVGFYGRDWRGAQTSDLVWADVRRIRSADKPRASRGPSAELMHSYSRDGAGHTAFFPDAKAIDAKLLMLLEQHPHIRGVYCWFMSQEDPADVGMTLEQHQQLGVDRFGVREEGRVPGAVPAVRVHELGRGAARSARLVGRADPADVRPHQVAGLGAAPVAAVEADAHDDLARLHLRLGEVEHSVHSLGRRERAGPGPRPRVVVGHHTELVDGPAQTPPVLRARTVPPAGLAGLGVHVDGDHAAVPVEPPGELLEERRIPVALLGRERLPVDVHAVARIAAGIAGSNWGIASL